VGTCGDGPQERFQGRGVSLTSTSFSCALPACGRGGRSSHGDRNPVRRTTVPLAHTCTGTMRGSYITHPFRRPTSPR
jgi:hypothetical protein